MPTAGLRPPPRTRTKRRASDEWMPDLQPYTPPSSSSVTLPDPQDQIATSALWIGFLIAPPIAPTLTAVLVFGAGMLLSDPSDTGTPIGIIAIPLVLLTMGVGFSYLFALIVIMPFVFLLRRKNKLNFPNLCWGVTLMAVILGVLTIITVTAWGDANQSTSFPATIFAMCIASAVYGLFLLLGVSPFWWIASWLSRRSLASNS